MNSEAYAEFAVELEDDLVEEDGEIVAFPGRNVAEAIAELLRGEGYAVGAPECADEHGWDLDVRVGRKRIWLEVQGAQQEYVLHAIAHTGIFGKPDLAFFAEFLTRLNEGLRRDAGFRPVKWYALGRDKTPTGDPSDDPLKVAGA
jgi:hypothetical protein